MRERERRERESVVSGRERTTERGERERRRRVLLTVGVKE